MAKLSQSEISDLTETLRSGITLPEGIRATGIVRIAAALGGIDAAKPFLSQPPTPEKKFPHTSLLQPPASTKKVIDPLDALFGDGFHQEVDTILNPPEEVKEQPKVIKSKNWGSW